MDFTWTMPQIESPQLSMLEVIPTLSEKAPNFDVHTLPPKDSARELAVPTRNNIQPQKSKNSSLLYRMNSEGAGSDHGNIKSTRNVPKPERGC